MAYNTNTAFGRAKVAPISQEKVGNIFLKTMKECNNEDAANEILLAAYMLSLNNYFEIENLYYEKFPSTLSI
ncbi:hypothetical protein HZQ28_00920 [Elizabethkingia anophelis]|nr:MULTISPECIES: hypothetical protein [Elizabethkingia]MBG0515156.1 hypothetical protein [Elizabethkingia meningoseptica]MCT3943839.1 hypothetical protein [Elizabethkingia anophelis]MCT3993051.1 hypothetical protein [Elizabethkingia anophelis]MCT3997108.1 hypothetical protein [Elizabethkingia anophelis]MCT4256569.1 hypothetical protein [Elizabethkingia anophelis]